MASTTTTVMIQIANMPRMIIRDELPTTPTTASVADDHGDENASTVSGSKPTYSSSRTRAGSANIAYQQEEEDEPQQHRQEQQHQECFRSNSPTTVETLSSSISVLLPEKYNSSLEILRTLSSESMQASVDKSASSDPDYDGTFRAEATEPATQIPRRNLTEAFEELYIKPTDSMVSESETPLVKQGSMKEETSTMVGTNMISPTGVAELDLGTSTARVGQKTLMSLKGKDEVVGKLTDKLGFHLHPSLQRDLTDALVQRVSFYAIIHDINKEAASMAANDESGFNRSADDINEEYDPIVVAVQGYPKNQINGTSSMVDVALVDEENWLLETIDARSMEETKSVKACPPTFPQAMGERDYENPLTSLSNNSRTQLWKPSRSWWEAKSGKNPWIEPKSHNKRWRYLWPLIHYHKFLAKCVKKLKRNGIDVKISVSPVSAFLREEVCAVSDHLASVSLFDSDEWMSCLAHFNGWTDSNETAKEYSRELVSQLKLRPLFEPGDVDSPLLRSQIDEQYLRAIATARAQLSGTDASHGEARPKDPMRRRESHVRPPKPSSLTGGTSSALHDSRLTPGHKSQHGGTPNSSLRHWHGYGHHPAWWQGGWPHAGYPYTDDASVQSALSADTSLSHGYVHGYHPSSIPHNSPYYPPMMYQYPPMMHGHPHYELASIPDGSVYASADMYNHQPGWTVHPQMGYSMHSSKLSETPGEVPATPSRNAAGKDDSTSQPGLTEDRFDSQCTPYKYSTAHVAMSPYWAHLQDHATLSMMGLATPQAASAPGTPHHAAGDSALGSEDSREDSKNALNAQPLLLRQQYYGYGQYNPPSPASQFLMTPQEQANLGYSYTYGSPRHSQPRRKAGISSQEINDARNDVSEGGKTTSVNTTPLRPASKQSRESPNQAEAILSEQ